MRSMFAQDSLVVDFFGERKCRTDVDSNIVVVQVLSFLLFPILAW
jgi:hypothetical protein